MPFHVALIMKKILSLKAKKNVKIFLSGLYGVHQNDIKVSLNAYFTLLEFSDIRIRTDQVFVIE